MRPSPKPCAICVIKDAYTFAERKAQMHGNDGPKQAPPPPKVTLGLGRIVAWCYRSFTLYQIY